MKLSLAISFLVLIIVSCSKDKFSSKPTLKLKEVSGNYLPLGDDYAIRFTLEYTDADGDIAGQPFSIEKLSSSASPDNPCSNGNEPYYTDSTKYAIPADVPATANQKGEIVVTIAGLLANPQKCDEYDSTEQATFKFWFKDQAGNVSDTVTTPPVTIQKIR
ncbi:MAG: hypothetical protein J0H29_18200 [Sphingobacteriales bacterium]|nr:hypothetical protein [Sphingobacteriales bacterium]